jgi:hypothetical protein
MGSAAGAWTPYRYAVYLRWMRQAAKVWRFRLDSWS